MAELKEFLDLMPAEFEKFTEQTLDEAQKEAILHYVSGEISLAEAASLVPSANGHFKKHAGELADWLNKRDDEQLKAEARIPFCRFLKLADFCGGSDYACRALYEHTEWHYHHYTEEELFGNDEEHLTDAFKVKYRFLELTKKYSKGEIQYCREEIEKLYGEDPTVFETVAAMDNSIPGTWVCAFLHTKNSKKYERRMDDLIILNPVKSADYGFLLCAINQFLHEGLKTSLHNVFIADPNRVAGRIGARMNQYDTLIDETLFSKKRHSYDEEVAEMDFICKIADIIGVDKSLALYGIINSYQTYHTKDLKVFFKTIPVELFAETIKHYYERPRGRSTLAAIAAMQVISEGQSDYRKLTDQMMTDLYDDIIEKMIIETAPEWIQPAVRNHLLKGQKEELRKAEQKCTEADLKALSGKQYILSDVLGSYAAHPELYDKICLFRDYVVRYLDVWGMGRFAGSIVRFSGWDGETFGSYFMEADAGVAAKLAFLDEMSVPDSERRPKETPILLDEVSRYLIVPGQRYLMQHQDETLAFIRDGIDYWDNGVITVYYENNPDADPMPLVELLRTTSKRIKTRIMKYIVNYPQIRPEVEKLAADKKKAVRTAAEAVLAAWLEMGIGTDGAGGTFDIAAYARKNMPKKADKLLSFTKPDHWPKVRFIDTDKEVPADVLTCYLCFYLEDKSMKRLFGPEKMRPSLREDDMNRLIGQLFKEWMERSADTKTKGMMTLLAIHGQEDGVRELKDLIDQFIKSSRSAMAGDAVSAIAAAQTQMALVTIDNIGRVCRNKQVRRLAGETLTEAARQMGLSLQEMEDKIVPTLGFDVMGGMTLETDVRKWTVTLDSDLNVSLSNDEGKVLRSFPKISVSKAEDECRYNEAKKAFNQLKKDLKNLVSIQTRRLEQALLIQRSWTEEGFMDLFVRNPVMGRFATSLIFGQFAGDTLIASFRYAGDGSFTTSEDEAYQLEKDSKIRLVHPLQLDETVREQWLEQLDDYELRQPFPQLKRKIYQPGELGKQLSYDCHVGVYVSPGGFIPRLLKQDWERGAIGDGGSYYNMEKVIGGYEVWINFDDVAELSVGSEHECSNITLGGLSFSKLIAGRKEPAALEAVPPVLYSETILLFEETVAATRAGDEE